MAETGALVYGPWYREGLKGVAMESCDVLREAMEKRGVKAIAADMNLSSSLLYKWCESKKGPEACGTDNPLDRVLKIYRLTDNPAPIHWLCRRAGGFLTMNPPAREASKIALLKSTQQILKEFSDVMEAVSESYGDDSRIGPKEATRIRKEWEELKVVAESFVVACERGVHADRATRSRR